MPETMRIETPSRLTFSPERHWSRYPAIIVNRDGNYCASWYRYPPPEAAVPCGIYFCKGSDHLDSIAVGEPVQVTRDGRNHTGAALCQDGAGQYHLAWHCWPERKGLRYLLLSRSADGLVWSEPVRVLPQIEEYMLYPSVVWHPSGLFWLAFSVGPGSDFYPAARVFLTSSTDGRSWKPPVPFPQVEPGDNKAALAIMPNGELAMTWRRREGKGHGLCWSASVDGHRWRDAVRIDVGCSDVDRPKLSADNAGRLWLSYESNGRIWAGRLDPGRSWAPPQELETGAAAESRPSALVQNRSGDFWLAWTSQRCGTELWAGRMLLD
ncbi:MAG: exo-alpha-sialidase [Betaproteobacteria bacterium]|nr:exo-alpha-sialidase [Betaproteobacteria bacterium]